MTRTDIGGSRPAAPANAARPTTPAPHTATANAGGMAHVLSIEPVTSGKITLGGRDITRLRGAQLSRFRRDDLGIHLPRFQPAGHADRL